MDPKWLEWAKRLQAISQAGLTYAQDPYDVERYMAVRQIAAEITSHHAGVDLGYVRDLFTSEVGHPTPKVDVRGAVFRDDAILLVRERLDGLWTLPGGWADVNEAPGEAVVREVYEESGYVTHATKLLAFYDRNKHAHTPHIHHIYKVFFQCELVGGTPSTSIETDEVSFFSERELPQLSISRITHAQIARLFEHYRHPEWPADFD